MYFMIVIDSFYIIIARYVLIIFLIYNILKSVSEDKLYKNHVKKF